MKISYTTKVKLFKVILLSIIVSITLLFFISPIIYLKLRSKGYIFAANMLHSLLKKEQIPPVFSGITKNGGAYYLSAEKINSNLLEFNYKDGHVIQVTKPSLMYNTNKNGLIFSVLSDIGIIDTKNYFINIPCLVSITSNQSYSANLYDVKVYLKQSILESYKPLTAFIDDKILTASGIVINQNTSIIVLKGPVEFKPNENNLTKSSSSDNNYICTTLK